jgi:hypothetical protein
MEQFVDHGGGMAIIVSASILELRGGKLPDLAPLDNPFSNHNPKHPTPPVGSMIPTFSKKVWVYYRAIFNLMQYGKPEPRSTFIPSAILQEWKANNEGVNQ